MPQPWSTAPTSWSRRATTRSVTAVQAETTAKRAGGWTLFALVVAIAVYFFGPRGYFHEPSTPSDLAVVAKVHLKEVVSGDEATTRQLQNTQIDEASARIAFGRPDMWGLATSEPLVPARST